MHSSTTCCCGVLTAGDSNESYMLFMCKEANKMGWRSVAMNYRSVRMKRTSPQPLSARQLSTCAKHGKRLRESCCPH